MTSFCTSFAIVSVLAGVTLPAEARIVTTEEDAAGVQACTLISPGEASAATGLTFRGYVPNDEREATEVSDCGLLFEHVDGVAPGVRIVLMRFKTPNAAMDYWNDVSRSHDTNIVHKVPGVGEDAFYDVNGDGPHDPKTGFMLSVLISPNVLAVSTRDATAPFISSDAVIALAKAAIN